MENLLARSCRNGCLPGCTHLVQDLHTVLLEAGVVVRFPRSPVSERHPVLVRPREETLHAQVVKTSPDVNVGCGDPENISLIPQDQSLSPPSVKAHTQNHYKDELQRIFHAFVSFPKFLCVLILTDEQVAFNQVLLRLRADGQQVGSHRPAGVQRLVPRLLVSETYVAVVFKFKPLRTWTPHLCRELGETC